MTDEFQFETGAPSAEMAQYLQLYLDETAEQLDALVEALLVLESSPADAGQLNEAFRLVHSIKGSSAMMGLDGIAVLTHHLENHFERLRSGLVQLDQPAMGLILRCIDFLRECNRRLRAGESLSSAPELLAELGALGSAGAGPTIVPQAESAAPERPADKPPVAAVHDPSAFAIPDESAFRSCLLTVRFEADVELLDLKAELVLARVAELGRVTDSQPPRDRLSAVAESRRLSLLVTTDRSADDLRRAADVDGVNRIDVCDGVDRFTPETEGEAAPAALTGAPLVVDPIRDDALEAGVAAAPEVEAAEARTKVAETVRVDIERLDRLMNLAGELVVNKARFVQIARQMGPAFRKAGVSGRANAFSEAMRRAIHKMSSRASGGEREAQDLGWSEHLHELESELEALEEQARHWENGRRCFGQIAEAIDQMSRVSDSLQRGVLDTRMVPVAPLFNRFKRLVRDIALELGRKVHLEIRGEKTELDKRMIDELGDPLVHLVRNAIDHGIEPADVRTRRGKSEAGTIRLEAAHSGNNVYISVRDDGGGIAVDKVRRRIVERGLLTEAAAAALSERDVIEHIWHPGFSTAEAVTDISGRGVGMDIVKTRIAELNGAIAIDHEVGQGTTFTIRLPLTLAIIRSLLFRLRHGMFAVPLDNVREIVSVAREQIISVHGRRTFDVRGEFIPLVDIDDIFEWHSPVLPPAGDGPPPDAGAPVRTNVVILHAAGKTMGLAVDELHGGQDIVIKSLAENFIPLRGLSGASILGDGSVCLLMDVGAAIGLAASAHRGHSIPHSAC